MLLDDRYPAYPPIVSECFILSGDQADDLDIAAPPQDIDTQMAIEKVIALGVSMVPHYDRRLDDANLCDRCCNLRIFG